MTMKPALAILALFFLAFPVAADDASIEAVKVRNDGATWTFSVTLRHDDTGWDDHADGWRVVGADGTELGLRILVHPHVNEQPFTRSQTGITIPEGVTQVFVEARTNTEGWGAVRFPVDLLN